MLSPPKREQEDKDINIKKTMGVSIANKYLFLKLSFFIINTSSPLFEFPSGSLSSFLHLVIRVIFPVLSQYQPPYQKEQPYRQRYSARHSAYNFNQQPIVSRLRGLVAFVMRKLLRQRSLSIPICLCIRLVYWRCPRCRITL